MAQSNHPSDNIELKTLYILGFTVIIPVLCLLLRWGVMPAKMPPSRNLLFSCEKSSCDTPAPAEVAHEEHGHH